MAEEIQTQKEKKNTIATIGIWLSIIWLIALISSFSWTALIFNWYSIVWTILLIIWCILYTWIPLFFIWFILWIAGLFYKPRKKARIAIFLPIIIFICSSFILYYTAKTPIINFFERSEKTLTDNNFKNIDKDIFNNLLKTEINDYIVSKTDDDWKTMYNNNPWSNIIEKITYVTLTTLEEITENTLNSYNTLSNNDETQNDKNIELQNEELENNKNDNDTTETNIDKEDENDKNTSEEDKDKWEILESEDIEIFTESEKVNIEEIINILE